MLRKYIIEDEKLRINVTALHDRKLKIKIPLKLDLHTFQYNAFTSCSLAKPIIYAIQAWVSPLYLHLFWPFTL